MADDKVGAVLIVGGGISGMQSALDLADSDFKVYLLENKPSIGGVMAQLDKTFPTNDCAMCIMAPKLVATGRHNNIEIISNAEIEKVEGDVGHFKVHINKKPRKIDEEKCTGCGVCAEKCPVEALDVFNENLSPRSATSVLYLQAVPLVYSIDTEICIGCGICKEECKAGAVVYDEEERKITIDVGSIILSPGFDEFDPTAKTEYGYGKLPNLGENILGSDFSFDMKVYRGAGAFVCGEETALIASIMGKPGVPRQRPPYPTEKGLWGCPTNINNVETWANVAYIINRGSDWYSGIGTEDSKGTKIFSLVGKINNTGLVEVPMGITLKEVVFDIGGGIPEGKKFKAIQTGGPSGGCIPEEQLHLPIDFMSLTEAGSIMGSGGMIVMDEDSCMVDIARYFTEFTLNESCGKCVSCREGLSSLFDILTDITEGRGQEEQIDLLNEVGEYTAGTSMCGLGQTAPNPVMSTLKYFKDEYQAHVKEHRCPAKVCKELISYKINEEKCIGCMKCAKSCPSEAITGELKQVHVIEEEKCIRCGQCFAECPKKVGAVEKVDRYSGKEGGQ